MDVAKTADLKNKSDIKILVVDDREDNLFSIETILEKDNYNIVKANSGRAALKILLKEHDFTLILMGVQMPGMNGLEVQTRLRSLSPLTRDIVLTSKDDPLVRSKAMEAGASGFFLKIVDRHAFLAGIESACFEH